MKPPPRCLGAGREEWNTWGKQMNQRQIENTSNSISQWKDDLYEKVFAFDPFQMTCYHMAVLPNRKVEN